MSCISSLRRTYRARVAIEYVTVKTSKSWISRTRRPIHAAARAHAAHSPREISHKLHPAHSVMSNSRGVRTYGKWYVALVSMTAGYDSVAAADVPLAVLIST